MQIQKQVRLLFNDLAGGGHSDKEYRIQLLSEDGQGAVAAQFGRRGAALTSGYLTTGAGWSKTVVHMTPAQASIAYESKLSEKLSGGYQPDKPEAARYEPPPAETRPVEVETPSSNVETANVPPCELLTEMTKQEVMASGVLTNPLYWMQKKENGRRLRILKTASGQIIGINRKNKIVPVPPEIAEEAKALPLASYLMDGEAMGVGYVAFEFTEANEAPDFPRRGYRDRFTVLLATLSRAEQANGGLRYIRPVQTWFTPETKRAGLALLRETRAEGAVFKRIDAPFRPDRNGRHLKWKFIKTLTAKIIPKTAADAAKGHNSIALGLLNAAGEWVQVGHASAIGKGDLPVGAHIEIKYLYAYGSKEAPHLVQACTMCLRDDQTDADCSLDQAQFHQGQGY